MFKGNINSSAEKTGLSVKLVAFIVVMEQLSLFPSPCSKNSYSTTYLSWADSYKYLKNKT